MFQGCNRIDHPCTGTGKVHVLNTVFVAFAGEFKGASLWINNRRSDHRKRRSADSVQILDDNLDKILHGLQKCLRVTSLRGIPKFGPKGGRFLTTVLCIVRSELWVGTRYKYVSTRL